MKPVSRRALLAAALPSLLAAAHVCAADAAPKKTPPAPGPGRRRDRRDGARVEHRDAAWHAGPPALRRADDLPPQRSHRRQAGEDLRQHPAVDPGARARHRARLDLPRHALAPALRRCRRWQHGRLGGRHLRHQGQRRRAPGDDQQPLAQLHGGRQVIRIHLRDATLNAQQERSADGLWFGQAAYRHRRRGLRSPGDGRPPVPA